MKEKTVSKKRTYEEIMEVAPKSNDKDYREKRHGEYMLGDGWPAAVFYSSGIETMIADYGKRAEKCVKQALERFAKGDGGNARICDDYGCYPSPLGESAATGGILVRLEPGFFTFADIIVYLKYEEYKEENCGKPKK